MLRKTNYAALKNRLVKSTKVYLIHASKNMKCHGAKLNFLKSHLVYLDKNNNIFQMARFSPTMIFFKLTD